MTGVIGVISVIGIILSVLIIYLMEQMKYSPQENPKCLIFLGVSGSGKTTNKQNIIQKLSLMPSSFINIDDDLIKKKHPLYSYLKKINRAGIDLQDFGYIGMKTALNIAIKNKLNFHFKITGEKDLIGNYFIKNLIDNGYDVRIIYFPLNPLIIQQYYKQLKKRDRKSGRIISKKRFNKQCKEFSSTLSNIKSAYGKYIKLYEFDPKVKKLKDRK